jgi:predicted dehydrogenase
MNPIVRRIGRRLRLAVVDGGEGSLIGSVHRTAARFDDCFEIVAAVLSRDPEVGRSAAAAMGVPRSYASMDDLIRGEREQPAPADVVAVMTPNESHVPISSAAIAAGFHVICDKPLANTLDDARAFHRQVKNSDRVFCLTLQYSGYPMIRQARAMVAAGVIGEPHLLQVAYSQGNLGVRVEADDRLMTPQLRWRLDPERGGTSNLLLDIGTHAHHLAVFVAGRRFTEVMADVGPSLAGRGFDDTAAVLGRLEGGARATVFVTKAATGKPTDMRIEIFGDRGGLAWSQASPGLLSYMRPDAPMQVLDRAMPDPAPSARRALHPLPSHPEGYREAMAALYGDFAEAVACRIAGVRPAPEALDFPLAADGVDGLAFVEACIASRKGRAWVLMPPIPLPASVQ